jgi:phosphopantetheinyl transferase
LWLIDLRQDDTLVERAAALLTASECRHAERGTPAVRRERIVSRAALRIVLARRVGCGGPHFSVSHSVDWGLIAVTSLGPVGVDIECCAPLGELEAIASRRFPATVARAVLSQRGEQREQAFYRQWTRMEAELKASGVGLAEGLSGGATAPAREAWTFAAVDAGHGLIGAVVVAGAHSWRDAMLPVRELNFGLELEGLRVTPPHPIA